MKVCKQCHAVCPEKIWFYDQHFYDAYHDAEGVENVECEGCRLVRVGDFKGTVYIYGDVISTKKDELLSLIRNTEKIDKSHHFLARIFSLTEEKDRMVVHTISQHLAIHIGMQLKKTYKGKLQILHEGENRRGDKHDSMREAVVVKWVQ